MGVVAVGVRVKFTADVGVVGFSEKLEVVPVGNPEILRVTGELNPLIATMFML